MEVSSDLVSPPPFRGSLESDDHSKRILIYDHEHAGRAGRILILDNGDGDDDDDDDGNDGGDDDSDDDDYGDDDGADALTRLVIMHNIHDDF